MRAVFLNVVFLITMLFGQSQSVVAQNEYKLDQSKSKLTISGTSTLHDWHMAANNYICDVSAVIESKGDVSISGVQFECKAQSISSDNSMMDEKAQEALRTGKFPSISFISDQSIKASSDQGKLEGILPGTLKIAGETKPVQLTFSGEVDAAGNLKVKGQTSVRMSDFKIKAPTVLMGSIKTGNEVTVHYEFYMAPVKLAQNK